MQYRLLLSTASESTACQRQRVLCSSRQRYAYIDLGLQRVLRISEGFSLKKTLPLLAWTCPLAVSKPNPYPAKFSELCSLKSPKASVRDSLSRLYSVPPMVHEAETQSPKPFVRVCESKPGKKTLNPQRDHRCCALGLLEARGRTN